MESKLKGRWFYEHTREEDSNDLRVQSHERNLAVTEFLPDGSFNEEGHIIIKNVEDGSKYEYFLLLHASGTWNLIEETLYVRYTDLKVVLEEAFVDDVIVFDIGTLSEIEKNILKGVPKSKTIESKIISLTDAKMVSELLNDKGLFETITHHKTLKAYSRYYL